MTIRRGDKFDTLAESGCIALSDSDKAGMFIGLDSEGVECSFSVLMIVRIR